ncbi:MAG: ferrochelatase [Pseudomonadales bacterium]
MILVNLGTPDSPEPAAIKRYLAEFLSDQRVVNLPRSVWLPILHGVILKVRPKRLAHNYQMIWGTHDGPIRNITAALTQRVSTHFARKYPERDLSFYTAMTYGNPSLRSIMGLAKSEGCDEYLIIPLYPQYAGATTGAVFDKLVAATDGHAIPNLRFISEYHDHPKYIHALAKSVEVYNQSLQGGAHLLFSFHGIPMSQSNAGDPYAEQCMATATRVAHVLGLKAEQWSVSFQSKFGPAPWLEPATIDQMKALPASGIKNLLVICPGFSVDCLETIEEIKVENRNAFLEAGGTSFQYIKALNATRDHVALMIALVEERLFERELRGSRQNLNKFQQV